MDMKSKNIVKLPAESSAATAGGATATAPKSTTGKNIDGFFRGSSTMATSGNPAAQVVAVLAAPAPAPRPAGKPSRIPNHARAHQPESPKTLMRRAVKPPHQSFKQQTAVQGSLQHQVPSLIVKKASIGSINPYRLGRATLVSRSPHISHHHVAASQPVAVTLAPLVVQAVPDKPEEEVPAGAPAPQPSNKPLDMFEHAMANASHYVDVTAQKAILKKHARRHFTSMAAGTLALLVIAGFAAYQNTPGLQFKLASLQAGVATHMPNFQAAGFAYTGVKADNGTLTVGFRGSQGNTYQLTQQTTNWSGSDMIQNISSTDASGTPNFTTVIAHGTKIYKFSNNTATWVSNGEWYQLRGTGALNDSQLNALVSNV